MVRRINKRGLSLREIKEFLAEETLNTSEFNVSLLKMWLLEKIGLWEFVVLCNQDKEVSPRRKEITMVMLFEKNPLKDGIKVKHTFINFDLLKYDTTESLMRYELPSFLFSKFLSYAQEGYKYINLYMDKPSRRIRKYMGEYLQFKYNAYLSRVTNKNVLFCAIDPEMQHPLLHEINF